MADTHFNVMWQFPKQKAVRRSYEAPSLKTLLRILEKAEDVSPATTEKLFVHMCLPDGSILEVVTHEDSASRAYTHVDYTADDPDSPVRQAVKDGPPPITKSETKSFLDKIKAIATAPPPIATPAVVKPRIKLTADDGERRVGGNGLYTAYPTKVPK